MDDLKEVDHVRILVSGFLRFSFAAYILLAAGICYVWTAGIPWLGVRGRVSELLQQSEEAVRLSLSEKAARMEDWLEERRTEALILSRIDSLDPTVDALALGRTSGGSEGARYKSLCQGTSVSRILVLRCEDGRVLVDSLGGIAGPVPPLWTSFSAGEIGQFRRLDAIYTVAAAASASGVPIAFVLVAPLAPLIDRLSGCAFDSEKGLGSALAGAEGGLLSPLVIPDTRLRYGIGRIPVDPLALEKLSRRDGASLFTGNPESFTVGAVKARIPAGEDLFILVGVGRKGTLDRLLRDSATMTALSVVLILVVSFLTARRLRGAFASLSRLNEAEAELRTKRLWLAAELCGIYAWDATEKATIAAVNILKDSFEADCAAIFYMDGKKNFRYSLAGTDYPITLPESRWRACVQTLSGSAGFARFGSWSPPGLNAPLDFWISYRLYSSEVEGGYLFLGRSGKEWSAAEETDLIDVARTIAPIIEVRHERSIQENERKEAEEKLFENERRLRTFLEGSLDMIYTADAEDVIKEINQGGLAILGRAEKGEILGRPYSYFAVNPEDRDLLLRKVREVGYAADHEIVLKRGNGDSVYCLETAYAIRDAQGGVIELQGIVKDITERMNRESALWKTNIELADANLKIQRTQALMVQNEKLASIGQLAAGVAHEINNPLGFLKSNHEMMVRYLDKIKAAWEEARAVPSADLAAIENNRGLDKIFHDTGEMLAESDEGFSRIMSIVANLKSFSRVEQNGTFQLYDVNAGIENTLVVARNEVKYVADVKLNLGDLPQIYARGSEINQVLLNIIVNAAQAIGELKRPNKGSIEIRTSVLAESVAIEIEDNGPGIPETLRPRIFDPFFTTKEPGKGTGLGLSISYDIVVSKHGGILEVDSSPGEGTVFTIKLPIAGPPGVKKTGENLG